MKLKRCRCTLCNYGLRTSYNSYMVKYLVRSYRHKVKQSLKKNKWEDLPEWISIPYTD